MKRGLISISIVGFLLGGCTGSNMGMGGMGTNTALGTTIGALAGAAIGAGVSNKKDRKKGAGIGAGAGAVLGGIIGYSLDQQADEVANSLGTNVSATENYSDVISVVKEETRIKISIKDEMMFKTNSYTPTNEAEQKLIQLSSVLTEYPQTILQIVGHTDDKGSYDYNYRLSERRAISVLKILQSRGIANEIRTAGCSYSNPLVANTTKENMALNRRVEIYLYPDSKYIINSCK